MDRERFIYENHTVSNIEIYYGENAPSYDLFEDNFDDFDENILSIRLMSREHKLLAFEEEFLNKFVKEKIDSVDEEIVLDSYGAISYDIGKLRFGEDSGYYFRCKKFIMKIDKDFYDRFYDYVKEHNKKVSEIKKLQLTFDEYFG